MADHAGLFALEVAARFGLEEEVRLLIEAGAPVDHVSNNGWTPLHWAAEGLSFFPFHLLLSLRGNSS